MEPFGDAKAVRHGFGARLECLRYTIIGRFCERGVAKCRRVLWQDLRKAVKGEGGECRSLASIEPVCMRSASHWGHEGGDDARREER